MTSKKSISIVFVLGTLFGLFVSSIIVLFGNQNIELNFINSNQNNNANNIEVEDLLPNVNTMNTLDVILKTIVSDNELIVNLNEKEIKVLIDKNTDIYVSEVKSTSELRADKEDYDRRKKENPEDNTIKPELPFKYTEKSLADFVEGNNLSIDVESNVIGKSEVKAKNIRVN